jgi:hypothetical protein
LTITRQTSLITPPPVVEPTDDVPWADFLEESFEWTQGEHVTICAPTGWGKTTLGLGLLPKRQHVAILATKPWDETLEGLRKDGYRIIDQWPPLAIPSQRRVIYWPDVRDPRNLAKQREAMRGVLTDIYRCGGWTVFLDELDYFCNYLKLSPLVELLWRQGRALNVSVVGGTQRPAFVPLLAYDQATHLFVGRDNDEVNLRRYSGMSGGAKAYRGTVTTAITGLNRHEFLYLNARREGFVKTKVA